MADARTLDPRDLQLRTETLGAMPIISWFIARLRLDELLERFVPHDDARLRVAPSKVLGVLVRNLVVHREPVYAINEWVAPFAPEVLGLGSVEAGTLNDDRVGRMLVRLFDADRASLLTAVVLQAVLEFHVALDQLHNDSTSVSFTGMDYASFGLVRGHKVVPSVTFGHSKDHRPDLRQLVWILTVSADGAVPVAYRVANGNTEDSKTHVATWDTLVSLVGRSDCVYVADCKLASDTTMRYIDTHGGKFVTVLPRGRKEVASFMNWIQTHAPTWTEAARRAPRRIGEPDALWKTFDAPLPSEAGFRVVWVHSSDKELRDVDARSACIEAGHHALEELASKLAGPRCRLKTLVAAEEAADKALEGAGAQRFFVTAVAPVSVEDFRQESAGRPGPSTRYRKSATTRFTVSWAVAADAVVADAKTDGMFPLVTNQRDISAAEVLATYRYQPNLERRHSQLKGTQLVAPMFLKDPVRIEGLLCCHFFALLVQALIEREIRTAMIEAEKWSIALYPEFRECRSPSAARVIEIFNGVVRNRLYDSEENLLKLFEPELTPQQLQVLDLLGVPASAYTVQGASPNPLP